MEKYEPTVTEDVEMTQKEIVNNTRAVKERLEQLKNGPDSIEESLDSIKWINLPNIVNKDEFLSKSNEMLELGITEAQMMTDLKIYLQVMEAEKQKYRMRSCLLEKDNEWLTKELYRTQDKLQISEQTVAQLEEEKKHLKFLLSLKSQENRKQQLSGNLAIPQELIDNLLPNKVKDTVNNPFPIPSHDYDTSARTRTTNNRLIVQYASLGRYDVAIPLCKLALDDLEKTKDCNHPDVTAVLHILAFLYRSQNKQRRKFLE